LNTPFKLNLHNASHSRAYVNSIKNITRDNIIQHPQSEKCPRKPHSVKLLIAIEDKPFDNPLERKTQVPKTHSPNHQNLSHHPFFFYTADVVTEE
jgi:hypothetical protein